MKSVIKNIQNILQKYSTGKNVAILFVITQVVYFIMLLVTIPNIMEYSNGMKILDMQPTGYNAEYVKILFDTLGNKGRNVYLFRQIPLDLIYPFLFGSANSLLLTFLFKRSFNPNSKMQSLNLIPIAGGIFDYLENFGIIIMLTIYPIFNHTFANLVNIFTVLKSFFVTAFFILLLVGIIGLLVRKIIGVRDNTI